MESLRRPEYPWTIQGPMLGVMFLQVTRPRPRSQVLSHMEGT